MSIDQDTISHISKLACLKLPDTDKANYLTDLNRILDLVEQLNQVDTNAIEPLAHPLALTQALRDDVITEHDQREQFIKLAQATEDNLYLVPKVIA